MIEGVWRRGRRWLLAGLVVCTLLATASLAHGDDTALGTDSGSPTAQASRDIRMEAETVQATVYGGFAQYHVDFKFVNDGAPQHVRLGFPYGLPQDPDHDAREPYAFKAWQDGVPLQVTRQQGKDGSADVGYFVHEADFPPGTTMITVDYLAVPSGTVVQEFEAPVPKVYAGTRSVSKGYEYWLHTGANWKGAIGKALVRYRFADTFLGWGMDLAPTRGETPARWAVTSPRGFTQPDGSSMQWLFNDFEPAKRAGSERADEDISLGFFDPSYSPGQSVSGPWPEERPLGATSGSHIDQYRADFLVDGYPGIGWGVPRGHTATARVTFAKKRPVKEIRVLSGNAEDFAKDDRPKRIALAFSDGTKRTLDLADDPGLQRFAVSADAEWVDVSIVDTHPGTSPAGTFISEMEFGEREAPAFEPFDRLIGVTPAAPPARTPVLLVHGIMSSPSSSWNGWVDGGTGSMRDVATDGAGWKLRKGTSPVFGSNVPVYTLDYSGDHGAHGDIPATARSVDWAVSRIVEEQKTPVFVVAHSMGGLLTRYYMEGLTAAGSGGRAYGGDVAGFVTLDTPHGGSFIGDWNLGPEQLAFLRNMRPASEQMDPDHSVITKVEAADLPAGPEYTFVVGDHFPYVADGLLLADEQIPYMDDWTRLEKIGGRIRFVDAVHSADFLKGGAGSKALHFVSPFDILFEGATDRIAVTETSEAKAIAKEAYGRVAR